MASLTCSFCNHANPVGAKFCNECGSPLGLRPCAHCDAINDVDAKYCHHCGTLLNERAAAPVGVPGQPPRGADAAAESSVVRALGAVGPEPASARAASPASVRELSSAAERLDAFWRDSMQAVEVARAMKPDVADAPADRPVAVVPLAERGESPAIDVGSRYRSDRRGARAALALAVLAAGAAAVYYAYQQWTPRNSAPAVFAPIAVSPPVQSVAPGAQQSASNATQAPTETSPTKAPTDASTAKAPAEVSPPTAASAGAAIGAPATSAAVTAQAPAEPAASASTQPATPAAEPAPAAQPPDTHAAVPAVAEPAAERAPVAAVSRSPAAVAPRRATGTTRSTPNPGALAVRNGPGRVRTAGNAQPVPLPPTLAPAASVPAPPPVSVGPCTDSVAALGLCSR